MPTINTDTRLCGVIGNPVAHSLSPLMHNSAFKAIGANYVYLAFRVEDVAGCLAGMRAIPSFRGLSVTIPHKLAVMAHLDVIEPMAQHIGSVNTVVHEENRLVGFSTDGPGALQAMKETGVETAGEHVALLGTGGAVRAVAFAMAEMGRAASVTILGRTSAKVDALVQDIRAKTSADVRGGSLETDREAALQQCAIIIQGTPVGMEPDVEASIVPSDLLRPEHVVFDMVYRPHWTRLLRDAHAKGCRLVFGIDMLVYQAVLQFERWTGFEAPADVMRKNAYEALGCEAP